MGNLPNQSQLLLSRLIAELDRVMVADQARLRQWAMALRQAMNPGNPMRAQIERLAAQIRVSAQRRALRAQSVPKPTFPGELPIVEKRGEISEAISKNQVVVLCGETGSGKTTQLPKICLELGRGIGGLIGHTQPRRIAARAVAARIAYELHRPLGEAVGFKIRFAENVKPTSYIKLMTDGILLAETQTDRLLLQYDTIIIDEAHERSLNIDFLLGYLKQLLPQRPDLKVIITSATIDPDRFSRHFNNAPILMVSGRTYPVETRYQPILVEEEDEEDPNVLEGIVRSVDELSAAGPGDILIFLSGEREIRETTEALRKHHPAGADILPLYSRLSADEQNKIFAAHSRRRVVLATNVAETSLTVPGIRYVIDPGFARISRYSPRSKVQRLPIEKISQASANQRKGRCGRVAAGICIRLYSEDDFTTRPMFMEPEILRTNLASVILQMKALHLGGVENFPFIEPPDARLIRDGYQTLHELGAVDESDELTPLGKDLARLPTDPRIGRMILAAAGENVMREVLIIASALSIQDPRERPLEFQTEADEAHRAFRDSSSDFLSFLRLWEWFADQSKHNTSSKLRKLCQTHFVSYLRMREWHDVHQQLHALVTEMGIGTTSVNRLPRDPNNPARPNQIANSDAIHRALLTGLLGNVGFKSDLHEYTGAPSRKFSIFPGSALFKDKPAWVMAAEIVETTRVYARTVAPIRLSWIEKIAAHLIERSYSELRWEKIRTRVEADEKITLWGMVIVPQRVVHYGPIDPKAAREVFLRYALLEGEYRSRGPFVRHNEALIEQVHQLEAKTRRSDLLVDTQKRFEFFDARVPEGINSGLRFEHWRQLAEAEKPQILFMQWSDVVRPGDPDISPIDYPDDLAIGESRLPLSYRFAPGEPDDGITLSVPMPLLSQLNPERFEWLIPALLLEKITALIKSLPTPIRRHLVPVPQSAKAALAAFHEHPDYIDHASLSDALASELGKLTGVAIARSEWRPDTLPDYLHMNFRILDDAGHELGQSRDLIGLQHKFAAEVTGHFTRIEHPAFARDNITEWNFGPLPDRVELQRHGMTLFGYPALIEMPPPNPIAPPDPSQPATRQTPTVSLRLLDSPENAAAAHKAGLIRLLLNQLQADVRHLAHNLPDKDLLCVHYSMIGSAQELRDDLIAAIAERTFLADRPEIRKAPDFAARRDAGRPNLPPTAQQVVALVRQIMERYHTITLDLERPYPADWTAALFDINEQLKNLMPHRFISRTPYEWLTHFPRYLQAIGIRMQKLQQGHIGRDDRHMREIEILWQTYLHRLQKHTQLHLRDPELVQFRWMIEELRVSLFAQELSTAMPISLRRLEKQLALVRG